MADAPERIRVAQDADGFWTCREAVSGSQEYVRADLYAALSAENERLREALKPFSEEAAAWVDHMPDGEPLWISLGPGFDPMPSKISINDLRRARAALAEGGRDE